MACTCLSDMGGRVFLAIGRESVRLPTSEMSAIADAAAGATGGRVVSWLTSKTDHGDADIVVPESQRRPDDVAAAAVGAAVGLDHLHRRDSKENPILFVGVETPKGLFQIDLIHWPDETADFCRRFLSWGDVGSMVGIVAREMGLKFGMEGLRVPVRVPAAPLGSVLLTADFASALDFLGFDPAAHAAGFADDAETAAWVGRSRHYDPKLYEPSRSSSESRRRGKVRRGRDEHLTMLRSYPMRYEWPETKGESDLQRAWTARAVEHFGAGEALAAETARLVSLKRDQSMETFSMDLVASIIQGDLHDTKATVVVLKEAFFPEAYSFSRWKAVADEAEIRAKVLAAHAILLERRAEKARRAARHALQEARAAEKRAAREAAADG